MNQLETELIKQGFHSIKTSVKVVKKPIPAPFIERKEDGGVLFWSASRVSLGKERAICVKYVTRAEYLKTL